MESPSSSSDTSEGTTSKAYLTTIQNPAIAGHGGLEESETSETAEVDVGSQKWKGKGKATEADYARWEEEEAQETIESLTETTSRTKIWDSAAETPSDIRVEDNKITERNINANNNQNGMLVKHEQMPFEIWNKIWKLVANNNPRNLDIWAWTIRSKTSSGAPRKREASKNRKDRGTSQWNPFRFITTQIVPPILHVNSRSRAIGLEYYKLSFGISIVGATGKYDIEPRIYRHISNDCICPMGRFEVDSINCFWKSLLEGAPAIAFNLYTLLEASALRFRAAERFSKDRFGDEDWRGSRNYLEYFRKMMGPTNVISEVFRKVPKIYLYNFTDYICKREPRDFLFRPYEQSANWRDIAEFTLPVLDGSDARDTELLHEALAFLPQTPEKIALSNKFKKWSNYGGFHYLVDDGPKPSGNLVNDNGAAIHDRAREQFFETLQEWEVNEFEKIFGSLRHHGFHGPGIPEILFVELEVDGWYYGESSNESSDDSA